MDPKAVRRLIIESAYKAKTGHIGSALSIVEILCAISEETEHNKYQSFYNRRDRIVLSKGHAALALYSCLQLDNKIVGLPDQYQVNGSHLGTHPEVGLPGIDFSTGSLGMGLTYAVGSAMAAKISGLNYNVWCILSDAEMNEGCVWEAAQLAGQHQLDNLYVFLDYNRQQAFGYTKDVIDHGHEINLTKRWASFGWDTDIPLRHTAHNVKALRSSVASARVEHNAPHLIIVPTTFGKGVSYMENQIPWHYLPMNEQQYKQALQELE